MAIIKDKKEREVDVLQQVARDIERRERRERICHRFMAGLVLMTFAAFVCGHVYGRRSSRGR